MTRCACAVLAIVAASCGTGCGDGRAAPSAGSAKAGSSAATAAPNAATAAASAASAPPPQEAPGCEALPFALTTPVPEASGAAWLELDGKPALLVVSDSGNHGAYVIVDAGTGATLESGALPLSTEASDDIEGVAARGSEIYGLTSSGWVRVWRRHGKAFELVGKPYPLGPVDLPDTKNDARPPKGDGMVCAGATINCGRNYEGLCLAPRPPRDAKDAKDAR
ncbi:MAG TPA: hypothetical protein VLM79_39205, partial [Kofleriaceae bacterium]|nr:hypothetical protein [Kofleriaceae bacterium]